MILSRKFTLQLSATYYMQITHTATGSYILEWWMNHLTESEWIHILFIFRDQNCQALNRSFTAGAVCVWVQVTLWFWLWVCSPVQDTEGSALPRKCSAREKPRTQPATGVPQPAGTLDVRWHSVSQRFIEFTLNTGCCSSLLHICVLPPASCLCRIYLITLTSWVFLHTYKKTTELLFY